MSFDRNFINIFKALSKKDQGVWEDMKASGKRNSESAAGTRKAFRAWQQSGKPFDKNHPFHRDNAEFGASKREGGTAKTVPEGSRLKFVGERGAGGRYAFVDKEGKVVRYLDTPENEAKNRTRLDDSRGIGSSKRAKKTRRKNIRNAGVYDWKRGRRESHPDEAGSPEDSASRPTTPSPETPSSREVTPSPERPASREETPSLKPKEASKRIRRASQGGNNPAGGREVSKPPKTREDSTIQERKPKQGELNLSLTKEYVMSDTINIYKAFGIQSRTRPESNIGEALDLYDDVLQKADMNWDNVSEEDLVQLEKLFGLKNPLKREKSDKEKTERAGLDASAVSNGGGKKEAPNLGFGAAGRARRDAREKQVKDAATAKRAASESPARRRAARAENIRRSPGRAVRAIRERSAAAGSAVRDAGAGAAYGAAGGVDRASSAAAAGGRATNRAARTVGGAVKQEVGAGTRATGRGLRTVAETIEPAGSQRRRRGGPEARAQRNRAGGGGGIADQMGRGNQGGSGSNSRIASAARRAGSTVKRAAGDEWGRMKDTAEAGGVRGFINPKAPKTEAPKAQAPTGSKPKFGEAGYTNWKAMEKALVSLQKVADWGNDESKRDKTLPRTTDEAHYLAHPNKPPTYVPADPYLNPQNRSRKSARERGESYYTSSPGELPRRVPAKSEQKMAMSKASVSLQKFLDDCGCDD